MSPGAYAIARLLFKWTGEWFPDGGRYFTRTLADSGPLQKITGTSDWRDFGLYFDATGAKAPPEKLTIGLLLPDSGEIYRHAPYEIYYPMLLVSAIALAVPALSLPGIRKRYEELELRRMRALDV